MRRSGAIAAAALLLAIPAASAPQATPRVCAPPAAADPMPEGPGHDHADPAHHRFSCGISLVSHRDLSVEIPEPMQFGEIDVVGSLAVMATDFPEAGVVVFDVTDPRNPVFRSRFRSTRCEIETDVDCGADVKLHPSGRLAFLALQRSRTSRRRESKRIPTGIAVLDLSDPARPRQVSFLSLPPTGAHLLRYHQIGKTGYLLARIRVVGRGALPLPPDADPRGGPGFAIYRLDGTRLVRVTEVRTQDSHDVSLYDDPIDRRTYLSVSGGRSSSLFFYDVTEPARPQAVGSWTPPDDGTDEGWYIHDTTMFRSGTGRFAVVGAEQFTAEPFHGNTPGRLWMLDLERLETPLMIGQWSNPGQHKAGDLLMSTHTSSYTDGFTWTAHYHGGVWLLDWRKVLTRTLNAPVEAGYYVPHEARRAFVVNKVAKPFISDPVLHVRPLVWDAVLSGGYAYVSDITGGLYVLARPKPVADAGRQGGLPTGVVAPVAGAAVLAAGAAVIVRLRRRASNDSVSRV